MYKPQIQNGCPFQGQCVYDHGVLVNSNSERNNQFCGMQQDTDFVGLGLECGRHENFQKKVVIKKNRKIRVEIE